MHSFEKISPPDLKAYGKDYPAYLEYYKLYRSYVGSLKDDFQKAMASVKARSSKPKATSRVRGSGPVLPATKTEVASLRKEVATLKLVRDKSNLIAGITANNAKICDGDGWKTVTYRRKKSKRTKSVAKSPVAVEKPLSAAEGMAKEMGLTMGEFKKLNDDALGAAPPVPIRPSPREVDSFMFLYGHLIDKKTGRRLPGVTDDEFLPCQQFVNSPVFRSAFPEERSKLGPQFAHLTG